MLFDYFFKDFEERTGPFFSHLFHNDLTTFQEIVESFLIPYRRILPSAEPHVPINYFQVSEVNLSP